MKKRISILLATVFLALSLSLSAVAADGTMRYVFDLSDVLTYEEWETLEDRAEALSERYGCGVYAAVVDDYSEYGTGTVADVVKQAYTANEFGVGDSNDGVLLMLSLDERDYALYACGDRAETAFNEYARGKLEEAFLPAFGEDDWAGGLTAYLDEAEDLLAQAESGSPAKESPVKGILTSVGISCVIALLVCLVLKGKMKSVYRKSEANEYVASGGLTLSQSYDRYTHTTETRRTIEKESSSGSSGGSSGGSVSSGKF